MKFTKCTEVNQETRQSPASLQPPSGLFSFYSFPYFGHLTWRTDSLEKTLIEGRGEGDDRGWDGWMASLTQWTWIWASSGIWLWTGRPGVLQSMGLQRVRHDWATELNWSVQLLWVNTGSTIAGSYNESIFSSVRNCPTLFQSVCTILYFIQQRLKVPVTPHPR